MLTEFLQDTRYGARLLRRNPGFTSVAVLSLGLGIGGATAVFSLVNAIVLRTLPVPEPGELVQAQAHAPGREYGDLFSGPMFERARDELSSRGAGELFAATSVAGMQLQADGEAIGARGNVQLVSGEYFTALRQHPQVGRLLAPADNKTVGAHPVAVVSDGYWRRHLNAAADAIGRPLAINGATFTIVGVTDPSFFGTTLALRGPDVWVPYMMQPVVRYAQNASNTDNADPRKPWPPQPQMSWLNVFGRVAGASRGAAESVFTTVLQRERSDALPKDASTDDRESIRQQRIAFNDASTGLSSLRKTVAQPLYVLLAMVGVLLAIACGNVAGLLLSRAAGRAREMAIRQSIGAGRLRLVRQMIAESLLLAIAGGLVGITFAMWAREGLLALMVNVSSGPVDLNTGLDWRVLAFATAVSALTGIACGVIPAVRGTRVSVAEALKQDGRGSVTEGGRRGLLVGKALVAVQMAFCLLLLVVAALFTRSLRSLVQTDIGFDRDHVLVARVDVRGAGYAPAERLALYRRVADALGALPGVESVSFSSNGPLVGSQRISSLSVEGYTPAPKEQLRTNEETVTDRYFDTLGLRILEGRGFTAEDRASGAHNTIVNATMARRFFPGRSPLGLRWSYGDAIDQDSNVIVGVVEDAHYVDLKIPPPNMAYSLAEASPDDVLSDLEVRTAGEPARAVPLVRETLARVEARLPVIEVVPLTDRLARGVTQDRMVASLTVMFGALALLLASLGLYGTISYGISRRVAELGLRMALGANRGDVLWMVLREALGLVAIGLAAGIPLAAVAARAISALLVGVTPADPMAFLAGAVLLLAVAAVAAYLPAYRASRIEPMTALSR